MNYRQYYLLKDILVLDVIRLIHDDMVLMDKYICNLRSAYLIKGCKKQKDTILPTIKIDDWFYKGTLYEQLERSSYLLCDRWGTTIKYGTCHTHHQMYYCQCKYYQKLQHEKGNYTRCDPEYFILNRLRS